MAAAVAVDTLILQAEVMVARGFGAGAAVKELELLYHLMRQVSLQGTAGVSLVVPSGGGARSRFRGYSM